MAPVRFAMLGAGFWSRFQLAGWQENGGVQCVAVYNRTIAKAEQLATLAGGATVYDNPEDLLRRESLDFVDIVTNCESHAGLVELAAHYRVPVICQKPMAPCFELAEQMVSVCQRSGVPFFIHENWRWQTSIRQLKTLLDCGSPLTI